jgi:pyruvate formate-lyase activating enzyme-like uncharacterized protein
MKRTIHYSYVNGRLAKGCQLCVQGRKLVLFITGLCGERCFFCPLSERKKGKDVVYANEWPIDRLGDMITEARLCDAHGAGITGGDPFIRVDRTVKAIRLLKKRFGKDFHIHLYAPLTLVTLDRLKRLSRAGLDEIRFHPALNRKEKWTKIELAYRFDWSVGVEIPVVPKCERETKELIRYISDKIDFLNLNELEISSTNAQALMKRGWRARDEVSYGVGGSEELALKLLRYCERLGLRTHYCTTTLKDRVQLAKRIKRRAKNVAQPYDRVTREGMLIRGAVYLDLVPGFGYRRLIERTDPKIAVPELRRLREKLTKAHDIPEQMISVDKKKFRLLTSVAVAKRLSKNIENSCAIVEEYPTYDQLEVEVVVC